MNIRVIYYNILILYNEETLLTQCNGLAEPGVENSAERGPLATAGSPLLTNTQKK